MITLSKEEFIKEYGEEALSSIKSTSSVSPDKEMGFADTVTGFAKGVGKGAIQSTIGTARTFQSIGQGVLAGIDPTRNIEDIKEMGLPSLNGEQAEEIDNILKSENNAEKAGKLTAFIAELLLPTGSRSAVSKVAGKGKDVITGTAGNLTDKLANKVTPLVEGASDVLSPAIEAVKRVPSRVKTNITQIKETEKAIKSIPNTLGQNAIREGVDMEDIKDIISIPEKVKPNLKKLYTATKDFVAGKTKVNPIQAVGKPVVKRIKDLKVQVSDLGRQLDTTAQSLSGKTLNLAGDIVESVEKSLDDLGVSLSDKGLDFTGSQIEGAGGNDIINRVFNRIINAKDSLDYHKLKKFIDGQVQYGKVKEGLTGDAEKILKTWRNQIDKALDSQFIDYKKINDNLASRLKPLNNLRRILRTSGDNLDEDLLDLDVGMLMQRIASNVRSNPAIRQILRDLDSASSVKTNLSGDIDNLVNFYAKLQDYFPEIVNKQSFRGQITRGVQDVKGLKDFVGKTIQDIAGKTDTTTRKAFEKFLDDFFN